jgi:hypothetical protein
MVILPWKPLFTAAFSSLLRFCRSVRSAESWKLGTLGGVAAIVGLDVDLTSGAKGFAAIMTLAISQSKFVSVAD